VFWLAREVEGLRATGQTPIPRADLTHPQPATMLHNSPVRLAANGAGRVAKGQQMARKCSLTGKRTISGRSYTYRGKAKYLGGVGRKVTGIANRTFKPNVQKVRAIVNGKVTRIRVSAKAIRMGLITKPPRRQRPQAVAS
jgi:large subunit ribosomal protein L28